MELVLGNTSLLAQVDEDDFRRFNGFNWILNENGYVVTDSAKPRRRLGVACKLRLHRLILACPEDRDVDHINGNKLDNRKANLRICTRSQNLMNRRPNRRDLPEGVYYTPVTHDRKKGKVYLRRRPFMAAMQVKGKQKFLGYFATPEEAKARYEVAFADLRAEDREYRRNK